MAYEPNQVCQLVSKSLIEVAESNSGINNRLQTGLLDALQSAENLAASGGFDIDQRNGKKKIVNLRYIQPGCDDEVSDEPTSVCESGDTEGFQYEEVEITNYAEIKMTFSDEEMRTFCESKPQYRDMIIRSKMNPILQAIDKKLVADFVSGAGGFADGVSGPKDWEMFTQDGLKKVWYENGEIQFLEDMANLGLTGTPFVVGAGLISEYTRYRGIGCCNDAGVDLSRFAGNYRFYRDRNVGSVTANPDRILAFMPGAAQLLTWSAYQGEFLKRGDFYENGTFIDPVTGIQFDMEFDWNKCDKKYVLLLSMNYELWQVPKTLYKECDTVRDGVNNNFLYTGVELSGS